MADREPKYWITVNGKHIPVFDDDKKLNNKKSDYSVFDKKAGKLTDKDIEKSRKIKGKQSQEQAYQALKDVMPSVKTDKQAYDAIKKLGLTIKRDGKKDGDHKTFSVWLSDTLRVYKDSRGDYIVQQWSKVNMKPSGIPTFDPSWQKKRGEW